MRPIARTICTLAIALLATAVLAQDLNQTDEDQRPRRAEKIPTEGFWPTQKMMERMIDRITEGMADKFNFDDSQLRLTREVFKARFPEFLNENRAEIQTLLNQYFEALLNDEPPAVEDVAEWAGRVQPLMTGFGEVCDEVAESMREYLNDDQAVMLDAQHVAFQAGMKMAQNKLAVWADGGYDPETEWIHRDSRRGSPEEREAAGQAAVEEAEAEAAAKPLPKDEWTIYTEQFIERYQLNEEQKQKAFTILRNQQEARDRYLRRKADEMAHVTKLLTEAETEEERAASVEAYQRLNAPVERIFEQLKQRLDTLPTRAQRKAAVEAGRVEEEQAKPPTPESAPSVEEREELEKLGYVKPPASQPQQPPP